MTLLRNVLRWQAALWAVTGLALIVAPGVIIDRWLDQPPEMNPVWLRLLGLTCLVLAAQMVLVARKLDEIWWWTWSFVLLEVGTLLIAVVHVLVGVSGHAQAWPWWLLAVVSGGFAAGDVAGLARAGTERSPV